MEYLAAGNIKSSFLRLGYVPEMTRLSDRAVPEHDVLFYGMPSPRRQIVLDELTQGGPRVNQLPTTTFGRDRDMAIADSRLYLNIHHYLPATLEVVRLGYLWANHKPVVSERRPDTELYPGLEGACLYGAYEDLAQLTRELLADENLFKAQGRAGFEAFSALSLEKSLEELVGRKVVFSQGHRFTEPRPRRLNIGSGRDFRNEAVNIDINPLCNPDIVLDLSRPLEPGARYQTERFGEMELSPGSFETITAFEVLEHVADLPQTMGNFLSLLEDGGCLTVIVPYDLSLGAWQDPTHVRAFNENSWLYYTDWAWYLGWRDYCFKMENLAFLPSSIGKRLLRKAKSQKLMLKTPRAIDGMRVVLRKSVSPQENIESHDRMYRKIYNRPMITWEIYDQTYGDTLKDYYVAINNQAPWRAARIKLLKANALYYFYKYIGRLWAGKNRMRVLKAERNKYRQKLGL
jgi:hypothetical protein